MNYFQISSMSVSNLLLYENSKIVMNDELFLVMCQRIMCQ